MGGAIIMTHCGLAGVSRSSLSMKEVNLTNNYAGAWRWYAETGDFHDQHAFSFVNRCLCWCVGTVSVLAVFSAGGVYQYTAAIGPGNVDSNTIVVEDVFADGNTAGR
jgi:hypothetical protein